MKRLILAAFMIFGARQLAQAQNYTYQPENRYALSVGVDLPIAVKNSFFSVGAGASVKAEMPIREDLNLTFSGGYSLFRVRDRYRVTDASNPPAYFIPVKAGAKLFFGDGLYLEAEGGVSLETNYAKRRYAVIAVGPGLMVPLSGRKTVDFNVRYEDWGSSRIKLLGIRVAYRTDWL